MTKEQYLRNLKVPCGKIDVVLDTDAYNEVDDLFAIGYMLKSSHKFRVKGICAAPFLNQKVTTPAEGMQKSFEEIWNLLTLMGEEAWKPIVYKGAETYLPNEEQPVESEAAEFLAELADRYTPEKPLYIVAIGAITNVASAILKNPAVKENCVLIWLGGHGLDIPDGVDEFNMRQDIAGARIVFGCGIPLVQLPCKGVVEYFKTTKEELLRCIKGKNALCDYLCDETIRFAEAYWGGKPWAKAIWDVTAVAWLLNEDDRFMQDQLIPSPIPGYDLSYTGDGDRHLIRYVHTINRDALFADLFRVLGA